MTFEIQVTMLSATTFGTGGGVAGLVDQEVEYDSQTGLPVIRGRTLKGLLVEECANILYALPDSIITSQNLETAAQFLFGKPGSDQGADAKMRIGTAQLPTVLGEAVAVDVESGRLTQHEVLDSLSAIRRQTAVDNESGRPEDGSLRAVRVVHRGTILTAPLDFVGKVDDASLALLAASAAGLQRGGTGRNRGQGRLRVRLVRDGQDVTDSYMRRFRQMVGG